MHELAMIVGEELKRRRFANKGDGSSTPSGNAGGIVTLFSDHVGINPLNAGVMKITDDLYSDLRSVAIRNDPTELKVAMRVYIDMIESLYDRM